MEYLEIFFSSFWVIFAHYGSYWLILFFSKTRKFATKWYIHLVFRCSNEVQIDRALSFKLSLFVLVKLVLRGVVVWDIKVYCFHNLSKSFVDIC